MMPFKQAWYIQDHVVKVEFWDDLTIEDIRQSFRLSSQFLQESKANRVYFIHDWSKSKSFPTNLGEIRHALRFDQNSATEKLGWVVIVGAEQHLLQYISNLTYLLIQIRIHMTEDFDSALAFIQKQDPNLKSMLDYKAITDVKWYLQGHILHCYDVIQPHDMILRNQNAFNLLEASGKPPRVHMLIDFSSTNKENYSADVRELVQRSTSSQAFQEARDNLIRHPLFGWVIVMGVHNRNIDVGGKIVSIKYNYKRKDVDTLDDALVFLKQIDSNIARLLNEQADDK